MDKKKGFKLAPTSASRPETPESLFNDLKQRSKHIQHLWAHQADLLREYYKSRAAKDVALELPTGAGKTLVGLLIGEWRRLYFGDRVLYLCPTRQLAWQAADRAKEYGIKVGVLVGKQKEYDADAFAAYLASKTLVVSTYSSVFNVSPRLTGAQTVLLDDAHASENYIGKMWSAGISRSDHELIYRALATLFKSALPDYMSAILEDDNASPNQKQSVEMVSGIDFYERIDELAALVDKHTTKDSLLYAWKGIRDHISACHVFVSWDEISIRPWIPPSMSHPPFAEAAQRIYMSATLGDGGDLERCIGAPSIHRIPVPAGWDKQGSGRRLILFPNESLTDKEAHNAALDLLRASDRAIVMSPSISQLTTFEGRAKNAHLKHTILHSQDIEDSLDTFTGSPKAILSVAGRYDGIDLPDDSCRIAVVNGLPATVSLQEEFLWSKLKLSKILKDRIRTRIVQGCGRCTRNATDYAVVVLVGPKLLDFMSQTGVQALLHPELRAEVKFGLENSDGFEQAGDLTDLASMFLEQGKDWEAAEANILQLRSETKIERPEYLRVLQDAAQHEVRWQYYLWNGSYSPAFEEATQVVDGLAGDELAGYRCLWNYLAGCAAHLAYLASGKRDSAMQKHASERLKRAGQAMLTLPWFSRLKYEGALLPPSAGAPSSATGILVNAIEDRLSDLQYIGKKFAKKIETLQQAIKQDGADEFEIGLTELGALLGFKAWKPQGQGEPDSVWSVENRIFFLLEAKSDESPTDTISISTCRQAQGHKAWLKKQPMMPSNAETLACVISPRSVLAKEALPHAEGLFYISVKEIRDFAEGAIAAVRSARSRAADLDLEDRLVVILDALNGAGLNYEAIAARFAKKQLKDLKTR